ncbi:MAG TPA: alpha/beta hydrolase family protein [Polyangiales bacterium]|nr:alpha/beta hydrolase family protein [Polyangiales bacterium]
MNVLSKLAYTVDRVFAGGAMNPPKVLRGRSAAERLCHADRMRALTVIAAFYNRQEHLAPGSAFFPAPRPIAPSVTHVRTLGNQGMVVDLTWQSDFEPLWSTEAVSNLLGSWAPQQLERAGIEPSFSVNDIATLGVDTTGALIDKYMRVEPNKTAHARWYRHLDGAPRPTVVILHGYMVGEYAIEERMWPVQRLFERGADVVLSVLPFHGLRRSPRRGFLPPAFPSADPRFTIEGMRQLVFDHQALFDYLTRQGTPSLGVMGISLGGYGAALLATVDPRPRCGLFFIPLSAIELFAHANGRFIGTSEEQLLQREAMRLSHVPVSPLGRPPVIRGSQVIIINGEADAITGPTHTEPLSKHFDAEVHNFLGGHLLHFGRARAFESMWRMLEREAFLTR